MDAIIQKLTHDNDLFHDQWQDTFKLIHGTPMTVNSELILNALADYVLKDSSPSIPKYTLVTMVVRRMIDENVLIEIEDLVKILVNVINRSKTDEWSLHLLQTIYVNFQIGEQLNTDPLRKDLIEQILTSLQEKTFVFTSDDDKQRWENFLSHILFSQSIDDHNILNKQQILTNMKTTFQQFYQRAVQQSGQCSIWMNIVRIFATCLPEIFPPEVNLPIENISPDYLNHLIRTYKENTDLIKTNFSQLLNIIEQLVLSDQYDYAHSFTMKLITPNLSVIDLESFLRKMIALCAIVTDRDSLCTKVLDELVSELVILNTVNTFAGLYFDLALAILKLHTIKAPRLSRDLLRLNDFYSWGEMADSLAELLKRCISYDALNSKEHFNNLDCLEDIVEIIIDKRQVYSSIGKVLHPIAMETILRWSNPDLRFDTHVYRLGKRILHLIDIEQINEEICIKLITALQNRVNHPINVDSTRDNICFFTEISSHLAIFFQKHQRLSTCVHSVLSALFTSLLDYPLYDEDRNPSLGYILMAIMTLRVAMTICNENDARLYEPYLDRVYQIVKNDEQTSLCQWWIQFWLIIGIKIPSVAVNHIEQFLEHTFNTKDVSFCGLLTTLYQLHSEMFHQHIDKLVDFLLSDYGQYLMPLSSLFQLMMRDQPERIMSKHIEQIFTLIETVPLNSELCAFIQSLSSIVNHYPHLFHSHRDKLFQFITRTSNLRIYQYFQKYLVICILTSDESKANEQIDHLIEILTSEKCSQQVQKEIVYTCLLIALKDKRLLIDRHDDFMIPEGALLLNYLDDTIVHEAEQAGIQRAQVDLKQIELIVHQTRVKMQENQLEISYNNIPAWASKVAEVLNRRSNKDWRSLTKQLGYSLTEIKHWMMKKDPCMALFHEWFTTHEPDEAVFSLIKALADIDRHDAEQIIRQAVLEAGQVIPDDLSIDTKRRPPIYLSFHSSDIHFATTLKENLASAGYLCQLYDEHTELKSIRGAKVIICCIDRFYTQSEHCSKVFQMLLNMKKPFIILHIDEQASWLPHEGIFQSVLRNYTYIKFCNSKNNKDWPENSFPELLAHVRYYVAPDCHMITDKYHHWFVPRLNDLIFLKYLSDDISFDNLPLVVLHPQIVLSYQWDSRRDVLLLYKHLTQLGYRVWLDLFQMAGGDTLVEKFDETIQQASCLLACITPAYMKAIHCQHQLSQANVLQKSVLPILLEETSAWSVSSIDWRQLNEHDRWKGKQFESLLTHLRKIVPTIQVDKPRHLLEMQRPVSASRECVDHIHQRSKRISSASLVPESQACSVM
ncbi:unnamed protein product [Adineta ricciae]|uniref:TIR domain-containing protein n=1 Tax=Adineta ricciae TaxID=249248 RepID=A0A813VXL9_ADIRI|nr:unnamed protein product [Adineta ricciae]